jgi:tetratricopeptide (TPR) repeat protein
MGRENRNTVDSYDEVKTLKRELLILQKDLKLTKSRDRRRELRKYIDDLRIEMAWALMDRGDYEQALLLYKSLSWGTCGEMKCNGMARALTEMGFYDEARQLLRAGLKSFPKSYALWVAMGALHDSLGENFESLKCMETALRFAPEDNSTGLYNKALILIKLGCYGDALPIINELIERYPDDPKHLAERGALALDMGYPQEALQYYQKAMELWQRSPSVYDGLCVYTGLCSSYLALGMKGEAMEIALEGFKKFPDRDSILYHNLAATFFEMGWRNDCIEILKKGLEKFPKDEDLKKFLKDVEDDLDDPDDNEKPPLLGILLLLALLHKRRRRK